ncbi:MAG TPA: NUDIX domain-containing protein, partial [Hanamia sp.]|nr:NUDIX domain-containing protein [Hanamia sp.]
KCFAFLKNKVAVLPVNTKKIRQKKRFFNYLVVEYKNKFYVRKRTGKDIWQNLYEFVLLETNDWLDESTLIVNEEIMKILNQSDFTVNLISSKISQKLTHQLITGRFVHIELKKPWLNNKYFIVNQKELKALPFPKFIASYLADKNVSLN